MKKVLSIALLVALVLSVATTVHASTADDLYAYVSKSFSIAGKDVKLLTDSDLVKVQRYLSENSITEEQYNEVKTQIDNVVATMDKAGVTDYTELSSAEKESVKSYVNTAAAALDLKVSYNSADKTVEVYNSSNELVEAYTTTSVVKLQQTGATHYEYLAIPAIAIIAIAMVAKNKKVNA